MTMRKTTATSTVKTAPKGAGVSSMPISFALAVCESTKYGSKWSPMFRRNWTDAEIAEAQKVKDAWVKSMFPDAVKIGYEKKGVRPGCQHDDECSGIPKECDCKCESCFEAKLDRADRLYDAHKENN